MTQEQKTLELANQIKELLGRHMSDDTKPYAELITSSLVALCIEVGRLRWLAVSTGEVEEDRFDQVFWEGTMGHYQDNKKKYGIIN